jgi:tRNA (mo5U34)-methyltransferase
VPGTDRLLSWVSLAGFRDIELANVTRTTVKEQRSTRWMRFESLLESLDPADHDLTIEGHPAPTRALLIARR